MAIIAAACEDVGYINSVGTYLNSTVVTRFDPNFARCAGVLRQGMHERILPLNSSVSEFWFHANIGRSNASSSGTIVNFNDSVSGNTQLTLEERSGSLMRIRKHNPTATELGIFGFALGGYHQLDIQVVIHPITGVLNVWVNKVQLVSFTGDTSTQNGSVDELHFRSASTSALFVSYVSEVIVADEDTLEMRMARLTPNAIGTHSGWTGVFGDIDEIDASESDNVDTNVIGQTFSSNVVDIPAAGAGMSVLAVGIEGLLTRSVNTPVNDIQYLLRSGGADFNTANLAIPADGSLTPKTVLFNQNPLTTAAWTQVEVDALEVGVTSV